MSKRGKHAAAILPHNKKLILWVTSPTGSWMLLSGHWQYESEVRRYAMAAGYVLIDRKSALDQIEKQMEERANLAGDLEFSVDVTRERIVTIRQKVN